MILIFEGILDWLGNSLMYVLAVISCTATYFALLIPLLVLSTRAVRAKNDKIKRSGFDKQMLYNFVGFIPTFMTYLCSYEVAKMFVSKIGNHFVHIYFVLTILVMYYFNEILIKILGVDDDESTQINMGIFCSILTYWLLPVHS